MGNMIRIINTPPGQAPEWVRKAWVGIELPIDPPIDGGIQVGVKLGKPENIGGYHVHSATAFRILEKHDISAWEWWHEHADYAMRGGQLVFKKDVCELIESIP